MDLGVFIPIGNNGWLVSKTAPQYKPSFELNYEIVKRAEKYNFDFALSMVKFRGFGGATEFWDYNLESITLMSALAAVTDRIKLYASTAVLTLPPAVVARMATTIDDIAPGRFGINVVSGWAPTEYQQMGLWPGDQYFKQRYDYATEYVQVMKDLWEDGHSDFRGEFFAMDDCQMKPTPKNHIDIVCAGQSERGMQFCAEQGDFNFVIGVGMNTPKAYAPTNEQLMAAKEATGRDIGAYVLFMVIADETDEKAQAKWDLYHEGADVDALGIVGEQGSKDENASAMSTSQVIKVPERAINFNMGTLVGSYESVARMLDEVASVPGTKGIMLTFDDFVKGMDTFGTKVQPLMECRR